MVYNIIKSSILNIWPSLVIISITMIVLRIAYAHNHRNSIYFYKEFWTFIAILYLVLLYELVTRVDLNSMAGFNLIPFKEILRYKIGSQMFYISVIGNIALFIPFGFIMSWYIKPKHFFTALIIPIIVSSTIELVQFKIGRSFDIDDILLNTLGCLIGYWLFLLSKKIVDYLPNFLRSKWFNNLVCLVIIVVVCIYIYTFWGEFR